MRELLHNATEEFEFRYSTPNTFLEAVKLESIERQLEFPVYRDDFFPLLM
jgi:hypothetical protein